jgi:hypothetical protein
MTKGFGLGEQYSFKKKTEWATNAFEFEMIK